MKKILSICLVLALALTSVFALAACTEDLTAVKAEAKTTVENAYGGYSETDYGGANWIALTAAKNGGLAAIDAASTAESVASACAKAIADMKAVKTLAQEAAEALATSKTNAKNEISAYAKQADYSEANWTLVQAAITLAKSNIDAAANSEAVAAALKSGKDAIDLIPTKSDEEATALASAKTQAKAVVSAAFSEYDVADYSADNYAAITAAKNTAIAAIDAATTVTGVNSAKNVGISAMQAIETLKDNFVANSAEDVLDALSLQSEKITLGSDLTLTETLAIDYDLTLDLNGHKITNAAAKGRSVAGPVITVSGGKLTLKNGSVEAIDATAILVTGSTSKLEIIDGTYSVAYLSAANKTNMDIIQLRSGASATIKGGTFTADGIDAKPLFVQASIGRVFENSYLTVENGEFTSNQYGFSMFTGGTVEFKGGEITTEWMVFGGNNLSPEMHLIISGGIMTSLYETAIYMSAQGTLEISGGNITGGTVLDARMGAANITIGAGATLTAKAEHRELALADTNGMTTPEGSVILLNTHRYNSSTGDNSLTVNIAARANLVSEKGNVITVYDWGKVEQNCVYDFGDYEAVYYFYNAVSGAVYKTTVSNEAELALALKNAASGMTVTVANDIEITKQLTLSRNVEITLDLNGHKLFGTVTDVNSMIIELGGGYVLNVSNGTIDALGGGETAANGYGTYGAFRVENGGKLYASDLTLKNYRPYGLNVKVTAGGYAELRSVTINSVYGGGIEAAGGNVDIYDCTFTQTGYYDHCSVTISASSIGATATENMGVVNVYGGSYTSENYGLYVFSSGGQIFVHDGDFTAGKDVLITQWDDKTYPNGKISVGIYGGTFDGTFNVDPRSNAEIGCAEGMKVLLSVLRAGKTCSGTLTLTADIDMAGVDYVTPTGELTGMLDGKNHTVSNLKTALVKTVKGGHVKDLKMVTAAEGANCGALLVDGFAYSGSKFENITAEGKIISASGTVAGLVKYAYDSSFINCVNKAELNLTAESLGYYVMGGIVGQITSVKIGEQSDFEKRVTEFTNCANYGILYLSAYGTKGTWAGQLFGCTAYESGGQDKFVIKITDCAANGTVEAFEAADGYKDVFYFGFSLQATATNVKVGPVEEINKYGRIHIGMENVVITVGGKVYVSETGSYAYSAEGQQVYLAGDTLSLNAAVKSAYVSGNGVKLIADINLGSASLEINGDVTLDLNGHSLTNSAALPVIKVTCGSFTVGGGTVAAVDTTAISVAGSDAAVVISDGNYSVSYVASANKSPMDVIQLRAGAKVTIEKGNFLAKGVDTDGLFVQASLARLFDGSVLTVNGGTFESNQYGFAALSNGKVIFNDGKVTTEFMAFSGNNTLPEMHIEINGGTVVSADTAIYMPAQGTLSITGGNITGGTVIDARMGTATISIGENATLTAKGAERVLTLKETNGMTTPEGSVLLLNTRRYNSSTGDNSLGVTVAAGAKLVSEKGSIVTVYDWQQVEQVCTFDFGTYSAISYIYDKATGTVGKIADGDAALTAVLQSARDGETVFVKSGTYVSDYTVGKNIDLVGFTGGGDDEIKFTGKFTLTSSATFRNLTISNAGAAVTLADGSSNRGGLHAEVTFDNCKINFGTYGFYSAANGNLTLNVLNETVFSTTVSGGRAIQIGVADGAVIYDIDVNFTDSSVLGTNALQRGIQIYLAENACITVDNMTTEKLYTSIFVRFADLTNASESVNKLTVSNSNLGIAYSKTNSADTRPVIIQGNYAQAEISFSTLLGKYAIQPQVSESLKINISNSTLEGFAALYLYQINSSAVTVENSMIAGKTISGPATNGFAAIVVENGSDNVVTVNGGTLKNIFENDANSNQSLVQISGIGSSLRNNVRLNGVDAINEAILTCAPESYRNNNSDTNELYLDGVREEFIGADLYLNGVFGDDANIATSGTGANAYIKAEYPAWSVKTIYKAVEAAVKMRALYSIEDWYEIKIYVVDGDFVSDGGVFPSINGIKFIAAKNVTVSAGTDEAWFDKTASVYYVYTPSQLRYISQVSAYNADGYETFAGKTIELLCDVDLQNKDFTPIAMTESGKKAFSGTFDGRGHTISNLKIDTSALEKEFTGFFAKLDTGTVKNLDIVNASVIGYHSVGVIAGGYTGSISNCNVSGLVKVEGNYKVGGIIGYSYALVIDCSVIGDAGSYVKATYLKADFEGDNAGGIVGFSGEQNKATVYSGLTAEIDVYGSRKIGGIMGYMSANVQIANASFKGRVYGNAEVGYNGNKNLFLGGIAGEFSGTGNAVTDSFAEAAFVTLNDGVSNTVGGIAGGTRKADAVLTVSDNSGTYTFNGETTVIE